MDCNKKTAYMAFLYCHLSLKLQVTTLLEAPLHRVATSHPKLALRAQGGDPRGN